jgi:hypothetical protein
MLLVGAVYAVTRMRVRLACWRCTLAAELGAPRKRKTTLARC